MRQDDVTSHSVGSVSSPEAAGREIQDGDIYRWEWDPEKLDVKHGPFGSYHYCSQLAFVRHGTLFDTYWCTGQRVLLPDDVVLTFLGNVADYDEVTSGCVHYHEASDIIDMRHSNSSRAQIYLRKNARRSVAQMTAFLTEKIEEATREKESAERAIERHTANLKKLQSEGPDDVYL